jgi:hypothetical protein
VLPLDAGPLRNERGSDDVAVIAPLVQRAVEDISAPLAS